jgi:hypothetical protein
MFPVPWPQRGFRSDYIKGAIHISFRDETDFDRVWPWRPVHDGEIAIQDEVAPIDAAIHVAETIDREIKKATTDDEKQKLRQKRKAMFEIAAHHAYDAAALMLEKRCRDDQVRTTLNDSVIVLGELLRRFNETIYKNRIEPDQSD